MEKNLYSVWFILKNSLFQYIYWIALYTYEKQKTESLKTQLKERFPTYIWMYLIQDFLCFNRNNEFCVCRSVDSHVLQNQKTEKRSAVVRRHREQGQLAVRVDTLPARAAKPPFGRGKRTVVLRRVLAMPIGNTEWKSRSATSKSACVHVHFSVTFGIELRQNESVAKWLNRYLIFFSISSLSVPKETHVSSKASWRLFLSF